MRRRQNNSDRIVYSRDRSCARRQANPGRVRGHFAQPRPFRCAGPTEYFACLDTIVVIVSKYWIKFDIAGVGGTS